MLGEPATAKRWTSQITPPSPAIRGEATPVSQAGFRRLVPGKGQNLTLLSIELHADTRCAASTASIKLLAGVGIDAASGFMVDASEGASTRGQGR